MRHTTQEECTNTQYQQNAGYLTDTKKASHKAIRGAHTPKTNMFNPGASGGLAGLPGTKETRKTRKWNRVQSLQLSSKMYNEEKNFA